MGVPSKTTEALKKVFVDFGPTSPEFYEKSRPFFIWLQNKYMGESDEDLTQRIYERFIQSLVYYEQGKISNIVSWCYSVGRHQISSYLHKKKKRMRESSDGLELLVEEFSTMDELEKQEFAEAFLKRFEKVDVEQTSGNLVDDINSGTRNHPLVKFILWARINFT